MTLDSGSGWHFNEFLRFLDFFFCLDLFVKAYSEDKKPFIYLLWWQACPWKQKIYQGLKEKEL